MNSAPPQHRTIAALAALATVACYGLANLSGLLHLALTRHEVCADHGALVHGDHARAAPSVLPPGIVPAAPHAPGGHGHDHCGVADHLRQDGLPTAPVAIAPAAPHAGRAIVRPIAASHRPIATLRFAPKHSPPAAA